MLYLYMIVSVVLIAAGGWGAAGEWPRLGMAALMAGLGAGVQGVRYWRAHRVPTLELEELAAEKALFLQESYEKAVSDHRSLELLKKELKDRELAGQVEHMQHVSQNLLAYLEKHPTKIPLAQQYIDYYQDRAVTLVQQYRELEESGLVTERVEAQKAQVRATLASMDGAYREQFERVLSDQMLAAEAEMTVLQQHLASDGLGQGPSEKEMHFHLSRSAEKARKGSSLERFLDSFFHGDRRLSIIPQQDRAPVLKRKLIQSALSIGLGWLGAHKFYQGKTFWGVLYLMFCWTSIPFWVGIAEGVRYLFMPMDDFYLQYYRKD